MTAYKLAVLEILRNLFVLAYILRVRAIPTYRVYRLYDMIWPSTNHADASGTITWLYFKSKGLRWKNILEMWKELKLYIVGDWQHWMNWKWRCALPGHENTKLLKIYALEKRKFQCRASCVRIPFCVYSPDGLHYWTLSCNRKSGNLQN